MPRETRLKQPPAIPQDAAHMPLLQALGVSITKLLPDGMRFTLVTFNRAGRVQNYISSHRPAIAHPHKVRRWKRR
jgi:hypothetical protein